MAGRKRLYSVREAIEMVHLPDGALSETESISDDDIADPNFEPTPESDSSRDDDEPLAAIARANPCHLDVEIHNVLYMQTVTLRPQMTVNLNQAQLQSTKCFHGGRGNLQQLT
ncbi:unnamed protein product [Knipowitschia caucasica]